MNKPKALIQTNTLFFKPKELKCMPMDKALMINTHWWSIPFSFKWCCTRGSDWFEAMIPESLILGMCVLLSVRATDLANIFVVNHSIEFRSAEERLTMVTPIQHNIFRHRHLFLRNFLTQTSALHYGFALFLISTCRLVLGMQWLSRILLI